MTLGHYHYYEAWWLETVTRGLPGHWQLWEAMPFVIAFAGIALMAWAAWRLYGAFGAALTTTVMLSLGDEMRLILFTPETHGYLVAHTALVAAALVLLAERAWRGHLSVWLMIAVGLPLAALSAAGGTDQLFEFLAMPSLVLAACLVWWRHPGRDTRNIAIFSVIVCALAIVGAQLADHLMSTHGITASPFPIAFVAAGGLLNNLQSAVVSLGQLGGFFWGLPVRGVNLVAFAGGMLALLGAAVVLSFLWRTRGSLIGRVQDLTQSRDLYVTFWAFVIVLCLAAFLLTGVIGDPRYVGAVFAGTAALLPAVVERFAPQRVLVVAGVALFAVLVAVNHIIAGTPGDTGGPPPGVAHEVLRFTRTEKADHGFASYYDAPVMTWQTRAALRAYPVFACGRTLCVYPFNRSSAWYQGHPGERSFLITDSRDIAGNFLSVPAGFGKPIASRSFGPYSIYIYARDIALCLGATSCPTT